MMADQTKDTQENAKDNPAAKKAKKEKSTRFDGRIALFGCRAAGKTVYIGSLFHKYHGSAAGINVDFVGEKSARYLAELQKSILRYPRTWPAPNVVENEVRLKLELDSALAASSPKIDLQLFDPPGEWLALGGDEQVAPNQQGGAKAMRDFVAEADGIFFFFEPDNFAFQVLRDKIKRALPELQAWAQTVDERLESLITSLTEKDADILALLQAKQLDNQFDEVKGILESAQENEETAKKFKRLLKGLFRDAELSYLLRKHELNVEPILANAQEMSQTRTPTGKRIDVLYGIVEYIQKTATGEENDSETKLLQNLESYFAIESNSRLLAAVTRLQEISKKAEEDATAENRLIAVIIAKADELAVFRQSPEIPYVLIPPHLEHLKFKTGADRLERLTEALKKHWEKQDSRWGAIIDQLLTGPFKGLFLKLMSFPGDFQIFFVSSVGEVERNKNGFVQPPQGKDDFQPKGVDQPVLWIAQQIYSHTMVHRAIHRLFRWAIFPLLLLLIPAVLFSYNSFLQSARERESDPALQVIQSYKRLDSLPMPPKGVVTTRIALLDFQDKWDAYLQQIDELFSRPDKQPDKALEEAFTQLKTLAPDSTSLVNVVAQHQVDLRSDAENLKNTLDQIEPLRLHVLYAKKMLAWLIKNFDSNWRVDDKALEDHLKTLQTSVDKLRNKLASTSKEVSLWSALELATARLQLKEIRFHLIPIRSTLDTLEKQYRRSEGWFVPGWSAKEPKVPENIKTLGEMEEAVKNLQGKLATTTSLFSNIKPSPPNVSALDKRMIGLQRVQADTQTLAEQLAASIYIEHRHLVAWQKYQELHNRLNELNLTGKRNEIASLLTQAGEVNKLTGTGKIVSSDVMDISQGKVRALEKMQQAISSAIVELKDYQKNGVPMTFSYTNQLAIALSALLADGNEQRVQKDDPFYWLPKQLPMALIAETSDIEVPSAPLIEPGDFKKEITIKVTGTNQTLNLFDTWLSYAKALESVLVPYDGAWIH
jgi:hypothetical protein